MRTSPAAETAGVPYRELCFAYDWMGRRRSKTVWDQPSENSGAQPLENLRFLYDGWNLVAEYKLQNSSFTLHNSHVWGLDLSGTRQGGEEARAKKQETRRLGSARMERSHLRAKSCLLQRSGLVSPVSERSETRTGIYYYGHRYYRPETGRWISREPLGELESSNLYSNCRKDGLYEHFPQRDEMETSNHQHPSIHPDTRH